MPVYGGTPNVGNPQDPQNPFNAQKKIDGIKKVIAVGAGKGGVGKSTISANLAIALAQLGKQVGLLDADVYGPSVPHLMGLQDARPNLTQDNKIEPMVKFGIRTMSLGFLIEEGAAVIWRGPMLFKAITQLLHDVNWGELDYLIVDLPPGTGDVQLTLAQKVPVDGAVIVSTPQDMALIDVKRCVDMFKRVKTPILGLVENMSHLVCEKCGHENQLFSRGALGKFCEENQIPLLGQIPFNPAIGKGAESGNPSDGEQNLFKKIAEKIEASEKSNSENSKLNL